MHNNQAKQPLLIVGVGNPYRQDDGIGPEIIRLLRKEEDLDCELLDGGTDALALLDIIPNYKKVILIDAVEMGTEPGTVKAFKPNEAKLKIQSDALSTHGFGVIALIELLNQLQVSSNLIIIGVQAKDIDFGEGLSPEVGRQIPTVIKKVYEELQNPT